METCGVQLRDSHKCSYRRRPMSYDIPYLEQDSDQVYEFRVRVKDRGGNTRRSCSYDYLDVMGPGTVVIDVLFLLLRYICRLNSNC